MFFFFNDTATTEIYTLSLHDALPILQDVAQVAESEQTQALGILQELAGFRTVGLPLSADGERVGYGRRPPRPGRPPPGAFPRPASPGPGIPGPPQPGWTRPEPDPPTRARP